MPCGEICKINTDDECCNYIVGGKERLDMDIDIMDMTKFFDSSWAKKLSGHDWVMDQKLQMRMLSKRLGALGHKKTSAEYIAAEKEFNV